MKEAERIAIAFHTFYEELAPQFGYETRKDSAVPWDQVPENNRQLMIATVEKALASWFYNRDWMRARIKQLETELAALESGEVAKGGDL